jgi:alkylation response protein AidB-like acyl-CoA dehydrogenase
MSGPSATQSRSVAEAARETEWRQPSFARELFLGRLRLDLLYPPPPIDPDDDRRGNDFLRELARFLTENVDPEQIEQDARIPADVVAGLRRIGAFGMKIDREYGGLGLSTVHYTRALQLLASAHSSLAALLSAHQSIGVPQPLALFGTDEQKLRYLPRLAQGAISAFLLTEPDVGSDPARLRTSATPVDDGYVLNGTKLWTTNGVIADLLVVMAAVPEVDGHRGGITAFVVDAHSEGVEVLHRNEFMGLRGIENGVTRFTDVRVPRDDVIGAEGEGLRIALRTLNTGRLSLPAICAAASKGSLKIAREWSATRVQWGKRIGEHEAVSTQVAGIAATAYALEAVVELTSRMVDAGSSDIRLEAALAKLYASERGWQAVDDMVQIRGGRGFETARSLKARGERPVPAEQILRDVRINRIFEGSSEIMRLFIAREAVDTHLAVAGPLLDKDSGLRAKAAAARRTGEFYARWLPSLVTGPGQRRHSYEDWGLLAEHLRYVERASRRLARATFEGMLRWQGRLEDRQCYLGRLVDVGAELFAMCAVCVHTRARGIDDLPLADLCCRQSRLRVDALFRALRHNTDASDHAFAQQVLDDRWRALEEGVLDLTGDLPLIAEPEARAPERLRVLQF